MRRRPGFARPATAALASALLVAPVFVLLLGSLHVPGGSPPTGWDLIPAPPRLDAFARADALVDLPLLVRNSLVVVTVAVPLSVVVASAAGFALTLLAGRAYGLALAAALVLLVIPASAVWVPRFVMVSELGLVDGPVPLMLPALMGTTPFAVLLFHWSFRRIPRELLDAARLEGLGPFGIWRRVAVPLVQPTTVAVAALVFVAHWGNFVDALLFLYTPERFTLPLAMSQLRLLGPTETPTILAAAVVSALPPVLAFMFVQGRFVDAARKGRWLAR